MRALFVAITLFAMAGALYYSGFRAGQNSERKKFLERQIETEKDVLRNVGDTVRNYDRIITKIDQSDKGRVADVISDALDGLPDPSDEK